MTLMAYSGPWPCPKCGLHPSSPLTPFSQPDADLLYQAYLGAMVLRTMLEKQGLDLGAATAREIINAIDARHPEFAGRSALR